MAIASLRGDRSAHHHHRAGGEARTEQQQQRQLVCAEGASKIVFLFFVGFFPLPISIFGRTAVRVFLLSDENQNDANLDSKSRVVVKIVTPRIRRTVDTYFKRSHLRHDLRWTPVCCDRAWRTNCYNPRRLLGSGVS